MVAGIKACQDDDGYAMAFPKNETPTHENPDYVTSWVAHGLLEAAIAGNDDALTLLRRHMNWFNYNEYIPEFLPPDGGPPTWGAGQPHPPGYVAPQPDGSGSVGHGETYGHRIYLIYQGLIHSTRMATSPLGTKRDTALIEELYQEAWWLEQLAARNLSAVWERHWYPHNYELTAIDAYAARRSSAEHLIATKALRCTATARMLIVAQCPAIP